jgi:hypothetical protein
MSNKESFDFELVVEVRDNRGNLTGKRKSLKTNSPNKLWNFFWNEVGIYEAKKAAQAKKISDEEATKILQKMYGDDNAGSVN